jgi:hypothetical protein
MGVPQRLYLSFALHVRSSRQHKPWASRTPEQPERPNDGQPASGGSHGCFDPHDTTKGHDEQGFCASFLWSFNDRHFVFHFGLRPVAFLLRDYCALCEAQKRLPEARFEHVYAARKRKIERDVLPEDKR